MNFVIALVMGFLFAVPFLGSGHYMEAVAAFTAFFLMVLTMQDHLRAIRNRLDKMTEPPKN